MREKCAHLGGFHTQHEHRDRFDDKADEGVITGCIEFITTGVAPRRRKPKLTR